MILLQDLITEESVRQIVDVALKASPYNALGYGIAMVLSLALNAGLFIMLSKFHKERSAKEEASDKFAADITKALIELRIRLEDTKNLKDDVLQVIKAEIANIREILKS